MSLKSKSHLFSSAYRLSTFNVTDEMWKENLIICLFDLGDTREISYAVFELVDDYG